MRLSIKGMAFSAGLLWGGAILAVGLVHLANESYGSLFLGTVASIYPGFHRVHTVWDVLIGTGYGLLDGACAGLLLAWLYNIFAGHGSGQGEKRA